MILSVLIIKLNSNYHNEDEREVRIAIKPAFPALSSVYSTVTLTYSPLNVYSRTAICF